MITIREAPHKKLGGAKSLFVSFDYRPEIVSVLKSADVYQFDKKTLEWEIPVNNLSFLLDNLSYTSEINLVLEKDKKVKNKETMKVEHKAKLFDHQKEAVEYGLNNDKWMLLDAPGLGKSLSMIALAEELKEQRGLEHCLVICGINTLKTNWEKEIAKHSNLSSVVIGKKVSAKGKVTYGTMAERINQISNKIDEFFVIINIESLRNDDVIKAIEHSKNRFDMMVFDECHKSKCVRSLQGHNLLSLSAKYMIAMTGTLLMNNPIDCYVPLAWIGMEKKNNLSNFRRTFTVFDDNMIGCVNGFKNLDILQDEIDSCSLRRTKDLLNLPSKNIIDEYLDLEESHKQLYDNVKHCVKSECDKVSLKSSNLLSLITRLRQATSCPSSLTSKEVVSTKAERCAELVADITSRGDKVVIFSNFKEPVYQLNEMLKEYNPLIGTGDMKDEDVSKNIDLFQEDEEHKVFIGTIQKMGTGVTMTRASYMIFMDLPWTYALYEQACDRIHRIGSTKPVFIYNLICEDTIDELVSKLVEKKEALSNYVIDNKLDDKTANILKKFILDM